MINIIYPDNPEWVAKKELKSRLFREKEERKFIRKIKAEQKREAIKRERESRKNKLEKYLKNIGKTGTIILESLSIKVRIIDFKQSFGNYRYKVEPISGTGNIWVQNITVDN